MKISERTLRISAASLLALLMIGASYLLSGPNFLTSKSANAENTEELLKAYASKDTDGDGLPDWQEALYGTDPNKAISNPYGIPDGQAAKEGKLTPNALASQLPKDASSTPLTTKDILADVPGVDPAPGSITEQFSHDFFQQYMETSGGQPLTDDQQQALINKLLASYSQQVAAKITSKYTAVSAHPDASVSVSAYAGQVEDALSRDIPAQSDVLVLSQQLVQKDDASALPALKSLQGNYAQLANDLLAMRVPPQLASAHIQLVNNVTGVAKAISLITTYKTDPIATLGAIPTFVPLRAGIMDSLQAIATAVVANGEPAAGAPGAELVQIVRSEQKQQ